MTFTDDDRNAVAEVCREMMADDEVSRLVETYAAQYLSGTPIESRGEGVLTEWSEKAAYMARIAPEPYKRRLEGLLTDDPAQ